MEKRGQRIKKGEIKTLAAVVTYYGKNGVYPTIEDLKELTGYKLKETVKKHILVLAEHGLVSKECSACEINENESTRVKIINAINKYYETYGFSPTVRGLGEMLGLKSSSTVHRHLITLKKQGKNDWNPSSPRRIKVLK